MNKINTELEYQKLIKKILNKDNIAYWERYEDYYTGDIIIGCSRCHHGEKNLFYYNFCPFCGAIMENAEKIYYE